MKRHPPQVPGDRIADPWGARTAYGPSKPWPVRVDSCLADGVAETDVETWVQAASLLHSDGDAMDIAVLDGRIVGVRGRAGDRVNRGRLEPKDLYAWQANPAVSLPELARTRTILDQKDLFLVVQDLFLTETAQFADVVLPAATWGEKTGTFTNADRTVHLCEKAVDPPGQARPDLDVFLDYAARMGFQDKDGAPLVHWSSPEEAFEAWKRCSAGRPCDYTGLTYAKLRGPTGIQWPCTDHAPDGTDRLYADGVDWAHPDRCETYGKDLVSGEPLGEDWYRSVNPDGKALIRPAPYMQPKGWPEEEYPFQLTTGRTIYHFHTRTKTGRVPELVEAAPEVWVEVAESDAARLGLAEGDLVDVTTRCGALCGRLRKGTVRPGVLFVPFHYGYWDTPGGNAPAAGMPGRAANELIPTRWDPVSKQPLFKTAAAALTLVERAAAPATGPGAADSGPLSPRGRSRS
ncbi:molybdopterin dinucleotide binding domain-containing protein [Streptomyces sp. NPDC039028]|uniref:molybdopterin dinucleotide binding domain-containing protein n=2 Tax=unclassified Streptomyces TaxID=2593676 RepID=UPI00340A977C